MTFDFARFASENRVATFSGRGESYHVRPGWIGARCPYCGRNHLGFNVAKGYFRCWACGHVKLTETIALLANLDPSRARQMRDEYDQEFRLLPSKKTAARPRSVPAPLEMGRLGRRHLAYLEEERGIRHPRTLALEWDLHGTKGSSGDWSWRVVAPIKDAAGRTLAYVGRSVAGTKPKYRVTDDADCAADPKSFLYGIEKATGDSAVVVEGPGDVWKCGAGFVATLGVDWHREQAEQLRRYERLFVMYDPEPGAQKKARELARWLSMFRPTEVIGGLPSDPGALDEEKVAEIRKELGL